MIDNWNTQKIASFKEARILTDLELGEINEGKWQFF